MKQPPDCPICGVLITPDVDGKPTTQHDQAAHDRRKQEDAAAMARPIERDRVPKSGIWDPPGDPMLSPYVRALIERRPDLKAMILAEYERGLRGERPFPHVPDELAELPKAKPEPELQRPRRPYSDD